MSTVPLSQADPDLLLIGKGIFYAAIRNDDGTYQPFFDMGNVRSGELSFKDTTLDVFSAREAAAPLYKRILSSRAGDIKIQFEEFGAENMRLLTMAVPGTSSAQAATPIVAEMLSLNVPATPVATLGSQLGGKVFHTAKMGPSTAIVVKLGSATLVLGTDYQIIQNVKGPTAIKVMPSSTATTNATDDLTIDYTPAAYASGFNTLALGKDSEIEVALKFVSDNSSGANYILDVWRASVNPTGVMSMISDGIAQGELTFGVLSDAANHPNEPLAKLTYV